VSRLILSVASFAIKSFFRKCGLGVRPEKTLVRRERKGVTKKEVKRKREGKMSLRDKLKEKKA